MSQHDYTIINQSHPAFRGDLNTALRAIASTNSGDTPPTTTFANELWVDTSANMMKIRNEANSGWIDLFSVTGLVSEGIGGVARFATRPANMAPGIWIKDDDDFHEIIYYDGDSDIIMMTIDHATDDVLSLPIHNHNLDDIVGSGDIERLHTTGKEIMDWNDAKENGFYRSTNSATVLNRPTTASSYVGMVNAMSTSKIFQYVTNVSILPYKSYKRVRVGSVWGDWEQQNIGPDLSAIVQKLPEMQDSIGSVFSGGVVMKNNQVRLWGNGANGNLGQRLASGVSEINFPISPSFEDNDNPTGPVSKLIRAGRVNFLIMENGKVYSWGHNTYGVLGHGNTSNVYYPKKISALNNKKIIDIAVGVISEENSGSALFLADTGEVWASGNNQFGQLGLGNSQNKSTPTKLSRTNWSKIYMMGSRYAYAAGIDSDGKLYTWGLGVSGNLGHGSSSNSNSPRHVNRFNGARVKQFSGDVYKHVSNFSLSSACVLQNGKVYTWGDNNMGALGHGDFTDRNIPRYVSTLSNDNSSIQIKAGSTYCVVQKRDGRFFSCGYNIYGQLGVGPLAVTDFNRLKTFRVMSGMHTSPVSKWIIIGWNSYITFAVLYNDGVVQCAGYNNHGQKGNGATATQKVLTNMKVPIDDKIVDICGVGVGDESGIGMLTEAGEYWQTGYSENGQNRLKSYIPVNFKF